MRFQKTCPLVRLGSFMPLVSHTELCRRPLSIAFIEISSKRIKVEVAFVFRHLVDVTALWHTSKVFESSLNNDIF